MKILLAWDTPSEADLLELYLSGGGENEVAVTSSAIHQPPSTKMPIEIQWTDEDPQTGGKRFLRAEKFAGQWHFKWRHARREDWRKGLRVTREMWEHVLDSLRRRYVRREGVSDEDIVQVERILRDLPVPRQLDEDEGPHEGQA